MVDALPKSDRSYFILLELAVMIMTQELDLLSATLQDVCMALDQGKWSSENLVEAYLGQWLMGSGVIH